jgi:hypothetical protein
LAVLPAAAIGAASAVNELNALDLLKQASTATSAAANQLQTIAQFFLRDQNEFKVGMVFFGLQVASIGFLILRSRLVPRIIGGLLAAGGSLYVISSSRASLRLRSGATVAIRHSHRPAWRGFPHCGCYSRVRRRQPAGSYPGLVRTRT